MQTDHFKALGAELFGYGWQSRLARALGMEGSTIRRWVSGSTPVAPSAIAFLEMAASRQATRGAYVATMDSARGVSNLEGEDCGSIDHLALKHAFVGIDKPKPMPALLSDNGEVLRLTGDPQNCMMKDADHLLVRHPDRWHLEAWLAEMRSAGHRPSFLHSRHHYYSAIVSPTQHAPTLTYRLSTHAGQIRRLTLDINSGQPISNEVHEIPGSRIS